jgi:hypothetical protein
MQGQLLQQMPVAEREAYKVAHVPARIAEAPVAMEQDKVEVKNGVKQEQQENTLYKEIQVKMLANVIGQMQKQMVQAM